MRSILAVALVAAAFVPATAQAGVGSCFDPWFASTAPQFVYYNPEIGMYYVDVAAAESYALSQPGRVGAAASCLAGSSSPGVGACARQFIASDVPDTYVVTVDDEITIDTEGADPFIAAVSGNAQAFVHCLV